MLLWLCIRLPRLAFEARATRPASGAGPHGGTEPAVGTGLHSGAVLEAMERLAAWAYQWTSRLSYRLPDPTPGLETDEPLLWLELGASRSLFGGNEALIAGIEAGLTQLDYTHTWALAPSPTGAALLARAAPGSRACTVDQLRAQLEPLPLGLLELPESTLGGLHSAGLRRIGELLELPAASLARRFGPGCPQFLQRLCALAPDPRAAWRAPERYRARCELGTEVHESTALLFPLQRMLLELQGYLRARDAAVQSLLLGFEHARRAASHLRIGLSSPVRDATQLLQLARERLNALVLPASVSALRLQALELVAPIIVQSDLFGSDVERLQELDRLLDRLHARLGDSSVQQLQTLMDHRPERACVLRNTPGGPGGPGGTGAFDRGSTALPVPLRPRPLWLLSEPRRIEPAFEALSGPERIESGWWDGDDVTRDYYRVRTGSGAQLWVYQDLHDRQWYLQGLWA